MSLVDYQTYNNNATKADEANKEDDMVLETRFADGKLLVIQSMVKQIRNGTPIYRLQLPIFLLEPRSLLERYSDFCNHLDFILRVPAMEDPLDRFLGVVRFYLSGWYTRPKDIRNPFNPVIGEVFRCQYDHGDCTTHYIAEQISHHPPSTAFCIVNEAKGMCLNAYIRPNIRFRGNSLDISLQGKLVGQLKSRQEDYEVSFPHILVRGVLIGSLQITLSGPARLSCPKSGYYADFDFKTKGILKGKHNYVVAQVKHISNHKKVLRTIEGRWDGMMTISDGNRAEVFLDVNSAPLSRAIVPPLEAQAENESRRVWEHVVKNILANNEEDALLEKTKVEEYQRAIERERKEDGIEWSPKLFSRQEDDYYVHKSLKCSTGVGEAAK